MKKLLAILLMLIMLMTILATSVAAGPSLHTASGGGTAVPPVWGNEEPYRNTYAFTVQQMDETGNAKGHFEVVAVHGTDFHHAKIEADIQYAYFEGNNVYISGVITEFYRPRYIGMGLVFAAQDNGEGSKASGPDKVSQIAVAVPFDSALRETYRNSLGNPPAGIELTNGNVQIK